MGENVNKGLTSRIQIPHFDPASNKITAESWIAYVQLARESAGWTLEGPEGAQVKKYRTYVDRTANVHKCNNAFGRHCQQVGCPSFEK